jgi:hypothetical protein
MKTQRERDAEKREEKLRAIDEAVASGGLVIRQMTAEERKAAPAKPEDAPSRPRRRR